MAEILIGSENYQDHTETSEAGETFVVLGKQLPKQAKSRRNARARRRNKIRGQTQSQVRDVWGTLGMDGARGLAWSGRLKYSAEGNRRSIPEESMPVTCEEIRLIRETIPEAGAGNRKVLERYISFEEIEFNDLPESIDEDAVPRLRLTLMLGPDEGALVYYQLYPLQKNVTASAREEVELEYIQPKPTKAHQCGERDRLHYSIPLLSSKRIEETDDGTLRYTAPRVHERFVVKVLTFKRDNAESESVLRRLHYHIWGHTHELLRWNPADAAFEVVDGSSLRPDVRTLFLIHGTMSSTNTAFAGLLDGGDKSWIAKAHAGNNGPYGQIIGFNHPTFSEDAEANTAAFLDRLPRNFEFHGGVDLITHSRGGLFGKYLALNASPLHIRRGALAACANGVGFFTAGRRIAKLLSILRTTSTAAPVLKGLMALAQHSGEFLMDQPGARLMTPGSDRLKALLRSPAVPNPPKFLPVVGDFRSDLVAHHRFYRRWAERGLDLLLKPVLGRQHDWVVGTSEQYIVAPECYPEGWYADGLKPGRVHTARHSGYFVPENGNVPNPAPARIERFLRTGKAWG
ncbi:MAG: hypothetical protein JJU00_16040 [Opitutales bacterium]|nr:hypothetical protein [Opitutales bacterium]